MNLSRLSRMMVAVSVLAVAPVGGVASAQVSATAPITCAIAQGPLTAQQESVVNDYEVQVARANARHTPVPVMPDEVFVLIGCISPASQTGKQTPASSPPEEVRPALCGAARSRAHSYRETHAQPASPWRAARCKSARAILTALSAPARSTNKLGGICGGCSSPKSL